MEKGGHGWEGDGEDFDGGFDGGPGADAGVPGNVMDVCFSDDDEADDANDDGSGELSVM